jgi:two-component system chemotaxis response regulator CheB
MGHAYTADALLAELTESVEGALWDAIRSVEERSLLRDHVPAHVQRVSDPSLASAYEQNAAEARQRRAW